MKSSGAGADHSGIAQALDSLEPDGVSGVLPRAPIVLLVDDSEDARALMAMFLRDDDFDVEEACNGLDGVELALSRWPDVIVIDVGLPDIEGFEVVRRIAAARGPSRAALIMCSANDSDANRARAIELGCCDFVAKPCSPNRLLAAVQAALSRR
jgi:DNA-binding response OmpR family regulator